ncbi:MAG: RNA-binding protein [Verrucomicrobiota bacterium]|jgi:RNA recognition motif-containing protein|nr:RNA-binding protein [Verrucomicrobiota bacterium]MED5452914.1 RNA-binding protein [Verrucomicrobiota bacterium]|tara:strand:+ start:496 stop:777 length:282 start_codon:yes stop_codon:yes gene_type:complete
MNESLLYVGNLPYSIDKDDLEAMFLNAGIVLSATLPLRQSDSRSMGFGFVEMSSYEEAKKGVSMFNNKEIRDRKISVHLARPRTASFVKRSVK